MIKIKKIIFGIFTAIVLAISIVTVSAATTVGHGTTGTRGGYVKTKDTSSSVATNVKSNTYGWYLKGFLSWNGVTRETPQSKWTDTWESYVLVMIKSSEKHTHSYTEALVSR